MEILTQEGSRFLQRIIDLLEHIPTWLVTTGCIILVSLLGLFDWYTGLEISFSIFYLLPVAIISWYTGKRAGILLAVFSGVAWLTADLVGGHVYSSNIIPFWNFTVRLGLFLIIAVLLSELRRYGNRLHTREMQLQKKQAIIQTSQRLSAVLAENITVQNSEILKWIDTSKEQGCEVPENVKKASRIIGSSLHALTEVSFVAPFTKNSPRDIDSHMELLTSKLTRIQKEYEQEKEPQPQPE